jgi:hypothetical protein
MHAILALIAALLISTGAFAAGATYPPAVWPYVAPVIGDGSTPSGGLVPGRKNELRNRPSNFDVNTWIETNSFPTSSEGAEAKFRTHCNASHLKYDDPIIHPGKPGASHLHQFFGNTLANAASTYVTLRTTGDSTCGGGPLNRSAYWYPAVLKDNAIGDGKTMVVRPDYAVVYYNVNHVDAPKLKRFYRGMRMVFGFNLSDLDESVPKAEITAANAQDPDDGLPNQASYRYLTNGWGGWRCESGTGGSRLYLRDDKGNATIICPTSERIGATVVSPTCWNGINMTSPDGRSHMRHMIREANSAQLVCPSGWFRLAQFELIVWFSHNGPDDYKEWYLSSDRMPGQRQFRNGESFHTDWFGAWDYGIMQKWMVNCNGVKIGALAGNPHSCVDTQFGDGTRGSTRHLNLGQRWTMQGNARFQDIPAR